MNKRILSFIISAVIFIPITVEAASVKHWKRVGSTWYYHTGIKWVGRDADDGRSVFEMPPTVATPSGDGVLTRLTGWRGTTYLWNGWPIAEPDTPNDDDDDPGDGGSGGGTNANTNKPKKKHTIEITLDYALRQGRFISIDTGHRVRATTDATTPVSWAFKAFDNSGTLKFNPKQGKSTTITIAAPNRSKTTTGKPLSFRVTGKITDAEHSRDFKQDAIAALRQQYVDLSRERWNSRTVTVPRRSEFKSNHRSTNYGMKDYGNYGRTGDNTYYRHVIMYMHSEAEKVYKVEYDSAAVVVNGTIVRHRVRITSGYRPPKKCSGNSLHQYGYAIDMNPAIAINTHENRVHLERRVKRIFSIAAYDRMRHGTGTNEHIHIEKQSYAQGGSRTQ